MTSFRMFARDLLFARPSHRNPSISRFHLQTVLNRKDSSPIQVTLESISYIWVQKPSGDSRSRGHGMKDVCAALAVVCLVSKSSESGVEERSRPWLHLFGASSLF